LLVLGRNSLLINTYLNEAMKNLLLEQVEYKVEHTRFGVWRRHLSPAGAYFAEFKSNKTFLGWPLFHYTRGVCPETGRRITAKGVIAVGRFALGGLAVGQVSLGLLAIGQVGAGLLFGLGQASTGVYALGQLAIGLEMGIGQIATGRIAIGQIGIGEYVLAQLGFGEHVWGQKSADPEAEHFFKSMWQSILNWWRT
jgi:hypothetical protein